VKGEGAGGSVVVSGSVSITGKVCTLSESLLVAKAPLTVVSSDCTVSSNVLIRDHPNALNCYNFECDLVDDCDDVDASGNGTGGISFGLASSGVDISGNLTGKYLLLDPSAVVDGSGNWVEEVKVSLNGLNVNARGFSISNWFRVSSADLALGREVCLVSKADDRDSLTNEVQNHIWSICLDASGNIRVRVKLGEDALTGTVEYLGGVVVGDVWNHLVLTYDGCIIKLFQNGVEEVLTEVTDLSGNVGNDIGVAFADFKGLPVFQGDQLAAIGSQPALSLDGDFRMFKGGLDQLVFWDHAISLPLVVGLYGGGTGTLLVPLVAPASSGNFTLVGGKTNYLTSFKQVVCVSSCFKDALCTLLGDNLVSLKISSTDIFSEISLSSWPGALEVLSTVADDCTTTYTIRLCLDFESLYGCALPVNSDVVKFSLGLGSNLDLALPAFVLTGYCRTTQVGSC